MDDLLRNQFAKESLHKLIKRTKHDMMERGPFHHIILGAVDHTQKRYDGTRAHSIMSFGACRPHPKRYDGTRAHSIISFFLNY